MARIFNNAYILIESVNLDDLSGNFLIICTSPFSLPRYQGSNKGKGKSPFCRTLCCLCAKYKTITFSLII